MMGTCVSMNCPFIDVCKNYQLTKDHPNGCITQARIVKAARSLIPHNRSQRAFTWNSWNFDLDGDAYIIAKDECPEKENVPDYIIQEDGLDPACASDMVVQDGWCKWMVRADWDGYDDGPHGGYVVDIRNTAPRKENGKPKAGWFPVWVIRKGEWY